jgi:thiamine-monophosphate kinase
MSLTGYAARPVLRSTAAAGDVILVTGALGGSIHGHHFDFIPRVEQGCWLAARGYASAMMDLSDGLAKDLLRLACASQLSYRVDAEALPCQPHCTPEQAWSDGEDYELLFTCPADLLPALEEAWPVGFPVLTKVGQMLPVTEPPQVALRGVGWDHFCPDASL